jgi:hypothetical protein
MSLNRLLAGAVLLCLSAAANAALISMSAPVMRQTGPGTETVDTGVTTGSGTWVWDTTTNVVTQTGSNTFTFGPNLPASVGYVLSFSNLVISATGVTTAGTYSCTDGNFADFGAFSICGGYNYYGGPGGSPPGNFDDESTLVIDANTCTRTLGGNDTLASPPAPPLCIQNIFNNGAAGDKRMSVRDNSVASVLRVRPANFDQTFQTPWGLNNDSGWEMRFTDLQVVPVPAAVWLLGSALGCLGLLRRRAIPG